MNFQVTQMTKIFQLIPFFFHFTKVFSLDPVTIVKESCGALLITFLIGNFISLTMEQPIFNLLQSYLGIKRRSKMGPKTD